MSGAMGQSRLERIYAFVRTKEGDLGEQLVRNGLARPYGFKAAPPGLQSSRIEVEKLQQLEDEAKREKIGAWGANVGRLNVTGTNAIGFQFLCCRWKDSLTLDTCGLACRFFSSCETSRVDCASRPVETNGSHAKEKMPLGKIDINTATEKELTTVPGIGHVMAARIIAARPFRSADDLKRVSGIGEKKYTQIRPYFQ